MSQQYNNLVFEGGGVKSVAYAGVLKALQEEEILSDIEDVIESIAVGIAFSGVGVVLIYFFPLCFQSRAPTRITGLLLMALGIKGTGTALGDIDVRRIGFDGLGVGLGFGILGV